MKYWDPQASSVKKFVDLGLGTAEQYSFPTLANKVLGYANQQHQFQSPGETKYIWGSRCTPIYDETDSTKIVDTTCSSNANTYQLANSVLAEIPRSYDTGGATGIGGYYNWYAATAESGTFNMPVARNVEDSLCPAGWGLPTQPTGKTWGNLIIDQYGASSDSIQSIVALPVSIVLGGNYTYADGSLTLVGREATYTASYGTDGPVSSGMLVREGDVRRVQGSYKPYGVSVRCVKK